MSSSTIDCDLNRSNLFYENRTNNAVENLSFKGSVSLSRMNSVYKFWITIRINSESSQILLTCLKRLPFS